MMSALHEPTPSGDSEWSDRLILEQECEHGLAFGPHPTREGDECGLDCPGGVRRELTVDVETAGKRLRQAFGADVAAAQHEDPMTDEDWFWIAKVIVDAALGLETAEGLEET